MLVDRLSNTALGRFLCNTIISVVLMYPKVLKELMYGATVGEIEAFQIHRRRLKSRRRSRDCHLKHILKIICTIICHSNHTMLSQKLTIHRSSLGNMTKPSSGTKQISSARRFSVRAEAIKMPSSVSKVSVLSMHGAKPRACNNNSTHTHKNLPPRLPSSLSFSLSHIYLFYSPPHRFPPKVT
jgi:hypothetical protein